jgi:hypothetical protein
MKQSLRARQDFGGDQLRRKPHYFSVGLIVVRDQWPLFHCAQQELKSRAGVFGLINESPDADALP